jgi:hypothetical protein
MAGGFFQRWRGEQRWQKIWRNWGKCLAF